MTELSIVAPVFDEEKAIPLFLERVTPILEAETGSYEILFVDDGSSDGTAEVVAAAHAADPRIKLLRLSRNYGKEAALTAGLDHVAGAAAVPMDVDLQDPPELLPEMIARWRAGADIVMARRVDRAGDHAMKKLTAGGFYRLMRWISGVEIPENVGDFRLLDRKALDALALFPERTRFMKGVFALLGFRQEVVDFSRGARSQGVTKYRWGRMINHALDGIVSFSIAPLRIWTFIGAAVALLAAAYGAFIVARTLILGVEAPGYASLATIVLFMNGLILIGLGVIGEYVSRIFIEVKQRPLYLVRDAIGLRSEVCAGRPSAAKGPELEQQEGYRGH